MERARLMARRFVQHHAFTHDVGEEIAAAAELVVHVGEAVDDQVDLGLEALGDDDLAQDMLLGRVPEFRVGHRFVIDHDEDVVIRKIAAAAVLHPVAPGMGAEQDELQDPPLLTLGREFALHRFLELVEQDAHDAVEFAALAERQMVEALAHR
jgi:hypothetical protein